MGRNCNSETSIAGKVLRRLGERLGRVRFDETCISPGDPVTAALVGISVADVHDQN